MRRIAPILLATLLSSCATARLQPSPDDYAAAGMNAMKRGDYETADRHFRAAIASGQDGEGTAFARDMLREMYGARLYPDVLVSCPPEAEQSYHAAEEHFASRDFEAATQLFRSAAEGCPRSAVIRVSWADTWFAMREDEKASAMFHEALAIDPWNRAAWRYLADTEARLGRRHAAWEAALFAVLSDPTYELGWISLARYSDGPVRRVRADVPTCSKTQDGALQIALDPRQPEAIEWNVHALLSCTADPAGGTPFAQERARVDGVLRSRSAATQSSAAPGFWDNIQAAKDAGFLDEAIYVNLLDAALAPEYATYRNAHRDRLVDYMKKLVTTPPPSPKSEAA